MRRVPVVPTLVVALAVALMIALGLWQLLIRLPAKEAQLAQLAANPSRSPVAFPLHPDDRLLFRRVSAVCVPPVAIRLVGGGAAGFRAVARCGGVPAVTVALGTTRDPMQRVGWPGGAVSGYLGHAPDARPLIAALWDHTPRQLMIVAETPPSGLARNAAPDLDSVPNNHLAYAVQWFFFAAIAIVIYALALRRRARGAV
ncbi:SURF1 family cytochrome oxidase biogenesis protein [Sphingomonas sp.]|uniref:SURF1 family cytochrome oxidase biogenesis protein n=1 Tax=Sphingomonas sp. TaxID=28214 RepID=UPI003CC6C69E